MIRALVLALTGEDLPVRDTVEATLTANGWDTARLNELRHARQLAGQVWPFRVPVEMLREVGFARFDAQLATVRHQLGLAGLHQTRPAQRPLNNDELRLLADKPPHW